MISPAPVAISALLIAQADGLVLPARLWNRSGYIFCLRCQRIAVANTNTARPPNQPPIGDRLPYRPRNSLPAKVTLSRAGVAAKLVKPTAVVFNTTTVFVPVLFVSMASATFVFGSTVAVFASEPVVVGVTPNVTEKLPFVLPIVTDPPFAVQVSNWLASIERLMLPELVIFVKFPGASVSGNVP